MSVLLLELNELRLFQGGLFLINSVRNESVVPVHTTCFTSIRTSEYELIPQSWSKFTLPFKIAAPILITQHQYCSIAKKKKKTQGDKADISTLQIPLRLYFIDQGNGFPCVLFISAAGGHLSSETYVWRDTEHCVPLNPSDPVRMSPDLVNKYNLCHAPSGNTHKSASSPKYICICVTMAKARATPPAVLVLVM